MSAGLPEGISLADVAAVLVPVALVTVLLRQFPYSAKRMLRRSHFMGTLGMTMPVGVMVVLVVYTIAPTGMVMPRVPMKWLRRSILFAL